MNSNILVGNAALLVSLMVTFLTIATVAFLGAAPRGGKRNRLRNYVIVIVVVALLALISWSLAAFAGLVGALIGSALAAYIALCR